MPDFLDLLILMVVIWTAGKIFRTMGLPVVFGELVGGILVSPAVFGLIEVDSEMIKVLAELGVFFLMLHAGLETDHKELFASSKKSLLVAIASIILPTVGGFYVAQLFGQPLITSLFIGMALSTSAIALGVRLMKDIGLNNTKLAHLTLGAAVMCDIVALILFSLVINLFEQGSIEVLPVLIMLLKVSAFFAVVIYLGTKTSKFMNKIIYFGNKGFTLTLIIALLMGLIAEAIGLHIIIGAFLAGLFIREEALDKKVYDKIEDRIYGLAYGFFGPIFFASLAFHLDFSAITSHPYFLIAIITTAIVGRLIGAGGVAHFMKMRWEESMIVGLVMNNRGAVELIIASIGLSMGIIDETIFSILVLMAFVATMFSILVATPLAKRLKKT